MILSQSRAAGTKVNTNVPLRITVAKAPEVTPSPSPSESPTGSPDKTEKRNYAR